MSEWRLYNMCDKAFVDMDSLFSHKEELGDTKPPLCKVCGGTLMDADSLGTQKEQHTETKPLLCKVCGEAFTNMDSLCIHKEEHKMEQLFVCVECKKIFTSEKDLDKHLETHVVSNASDVDKSNAKDSVLTNCPDSGSLNPESNIFDAEMQGSITRDYGLETSKTLDITMPDSNRAKSMEEKKRSSYRRVFFLQLMCRKIKRKYRKYFLKTLNVLKLKNLSAVPTSLRKRKQFNCTPKLISSPNAIRTDGKPSQSKECDNTSLVRDPGWTRYSGACDLTAKTSPNPESVIRQCTYGDNFRRRSGERSYNCDVCRKIFTQKGNVRKH